MKHKYPSEAQLRKLCNKEGPLAAAAAECGGTLITVPIPKIRKVGRGCGSPVPVPATAGKVPCGAFLNWPDGEREEHLCDHCRNEIDPDHINNTGRRNMRTDKMHPVPWRHETDGKKMSAVVDADGHVVCGSLICQQADATKQRQTHAYIVQKANNTALPPKRSGRQELAAFRLLAGVCGHRSPPVVCYHPDNPGTRGSFRCGGKCAKGVCPIWRDIHKAEDV